MNMLYRACIAPLLCVWFYGLPLVTTASWTKDETQLHWKWLLWERNYLTRVTIDGSLYQVDFVVKVFCIS